MSAATFSSFFEKATEGHSPYPYQIAFAENSTLPELLNVPTGVGKTATAVLGWLYRRREGALRDRETTPRRLVYCLPMRTLVEQTSDCAQKWLANLGLNEDGPRIAQAAASDLKAALPRKAQFVGALRELGLIPPKGK